MSTVESFLERVRCVQHAVPRAGQSKGAPLRFELSGAVVDVHYVLFTGNDPLASLRADVAKARADSVPARGELALGSNESVLDLT